MIEMLEPRRLFHSFTLNKGLLTMITHDDPETIGLRIVGQNYLASLEEEEVEETFSVSDVQRVLIQALAGDDTISVNPSVKIPVTIQAGDGNDTLFAGAGPTELQGNGGDDLLVDGGGDDTFVGGEGNDTADFSARTDNLKLICGGGAVSGGVGQHADVGLDVETLVGGSGGDLIDGSRSSSDRLLMGNGGKDILIGGGGVDTLAGGNKNDSLIGGQGADILIGGAGKRDSAEYLNRSDDLSLTLDSVANDGASGENDSLSPTIENLLGGGGNDFIRGNGRANVLSGGGGDDTILGGSGDDIIVGGVGRDQLFGQAGQDELRSGDGEKDTVSGGSGTDVVIEPDPIDVIDSVP